MHHVAALCLSAGLSACVVLPPGASSMAMTATGASSGETTARAPANDMGMQINAIRAESGRPGLTASPLLTRIAQSHAEDMARAGAMSHRGSDGRDLAARLRHFGCSHRGAAENLAFGMRSPEQAINGWAVRPEHRSNILGPYTRYGSGAARGFYVTVFARGC
jgi:uncharacterized protein YkwD